MASAKSPTVRRRRLCGELRRLREAAGMTCEEVARQLECTASRISKIEGGRLGIRPGDVRELLDIYKISGAEADRLVLLAREARKRGWWHVYNDVTSDAFRTFVGLETEASSITSYEAHYIPGLLQTEDYARELFLAARPTLDPERVARRTELRMARQQLLTQASPPDLWVVLDEAVLRRRTGRPDVMRAQLEHLLLSGDLPNVTIQVVTFEAGFHYGMGSGFTIFQFPDPLDESVAYTENIAGAMFMEDKAEISRYSMAFNHLRSAALSDSRSKQLVSDVARSL
ncbi:helix-turn-helix domain-containing protein [Catellatospora methionotrophica]|uniref:helix-turn-helix domain-containing protein n=1 Tax=Catellatospora methionotrophica TaxID=121620 RepID=UPI0033C3A783